MSRHVFRLPDLGEGTVQAEIIAWRVKPGDVVAEDDVIVEVMTDKAAVEVPAPVSGKVVSTTGQPGESVPVGAELIVFETDDSAPHPGEADEQEPVPTPAVHATAPAESQVEPAGRVATSPAIRRRAREAGIDLSRIRGSGPHGRIVREDLDSVIVAERHGSAPLEQAPVDSGTARGARSAASGKPAASPKPAAGAVEEIKVIGVRRLIAQKMSESKRNIPHFSYVEEIDVTELESLRRHLNADPGHSGSLSYLPFLAAALVRVLAEFPQCNATYDADRGVIIRHRSIHIGVATQTPDGLKVPVVHDAEGLSLRDLAAEMARVSEAARRGTAKREELVGSTITVSSLGKLGGIASTPIINAPEVAIIGVNRALERPVVVDGQVVVRRMMNLSSSFDHRFVDGYDAAAMIQALKQRLEHPATIFIER